MWDLKRSQGSSLPHSKTQPRQLSCLAASVVTTECYRLFNLCIKRSLQLIIVYSAQIYRISGGCIDLMKDPFLQLANAVNPFFRHYSSPRILGFSVTIVMIAGVIALTISNYKCSDVVTSTKKFEAVDGMFTLQKVFIDAFTERPVGLADDVKREENLCTLYATTRRYHTFNDAQGTGNSVTQALADSCVLPPDQFLDHLNFPPAFYFCDLDTVPDK